MMFSEFVNVLECLAKTPEGMTVTQIRKMSLMEKSRVETTLKHLEFEHFVTKEIKPHRPNISKRVFKITERAAEYCSYVSTTYAENEAKHAS